jgi:hypothetical protein
VRIVTLTFIDAEHGARPVAGRTVGDRVLLEPAAVESLTGWALRPEGLCRDALCVPVRDPDLAVDGALDAARFAMALGRPAVVDAAAGVVALGEPSATRRGAIESGAAPDFTLPTLTGGDFTFSAIGRNKKLLLAWSSW